MTCQHCVLPIEEIEGVWTHLHSMSRFCDSWWTVAVPAPEVTP